MLCFYYTVGFPRSATVLTQRLVDQGRQAPPAQWPAAHRVHSLRLQRGRARGAPRQPQPAPPAARRRSLTRSSTQPAAPAAANGRIPARPIASRPRVGRPPSEPFLIPKLRNHFVDFPHRAFALSTRACSAWRPAAVLGTARADTAALRRLARRGFHGPRHTESGRAAEGWAPCSG